MLKVKQNQKQSRDPKETSEREKGAEKNLKGNTKNGVLTLPKSVEDLPLILKTQRFDPRKRKRKDEYFGDLLARIRTILYIFAEHISTDSVYNEHISTNTTAQFSLMWPKEI